MSGRMLSRGMVLSLLLLILFCNSQRILGSSDVSQEPLQTKPTTGSSGTRKDSQCHAGVNGVCSPSADEQSEAEGKAQEAEHEKDKYLSSANILQRGMDSLEEMLENSGMKEKFGDVMEQVVHSKDRMIQGLDDVMDKMSASKSKVMEELDHVIDKVTHSKMMEEIRALPRELRESFLLHVRNRSYVVSGVMVAVTAAILVGGALYFAWCHHEGWHHGPSHTNWEISQKEATAINGAKSDSNGAAGGAVSNGVKHSSGDTNTNMSQDTAVSDGQKHLEPSENVDSVSNGGVKTADVGLEEAGGDDVLEDDVVMSVSQKTLDASVQEESKSNSPEGPSLGVSTSKSAFSDLPAAQGGSTLPVYHDGKGDVEVPKKSVTQKPSLARDAFENGDEKGSVETLCVKSAGTEKGSGDEHCLKESDADQSRPEDDLGKVAPAILTKLAHSEKGEKTVACAVAEDSNCQVKDT